MLIKVNGIDITSRLIEYKITAQTSGDSLLLGNSVTKQVIMKLDNQDGEMNSLLDYPFFINYDENKKTGVFKVYEKPEKYTGTLSLTLYDNMYLLSQRYDTKLDYEKGATIKDQLNEMNSLIGVEGGDPFILGVTKLPHVLGEGGKSLIDYSALSQDILNKVVNWYDNTIPMRNYLGWIAELDGCNVFADEDGTIVFRPLAKSVHTTYDVETFEKGELVVFSRVCFDNGLLKIEEGTDVGNTLYISSNNAYVDSDTTLSHILNKYLGLTFYSIQSLKMANIEGLYLTDLINYNNEFLFMPLSVTEVYGGGQYSIATVDGTVSTINQEITVNKIDQSVRIKRIQTILNQNTASMEIIAKDVDDTKSQIASMEIAVDSISSNISSVEEKQVDIDGELQTMIESYNLFVQQTSSSMNAIIKESKEYTDSITEKSREIATYIAATIRGLEISASDTDDLELSRIKTLMAPDRFAVLFDEYEATKIFKEGIETENIWLSKSLTLDPLVFKGYGNGDSGGIVIKWGGHS